MKTAIIKLKSLSAMSQSRKHDAPKLERELAGDYENRTWRNKLHVNGEGFICIPAFALKCSLVAAAKYSGEQIPGKGKSTWTKKFQSGTMITEDAVTNAKAEDARPIHINANADGVRGSGKRVDRIMPTVLQWETTVTIHILDEIITRDVLERYMDFAGKFIGIGQYRPESGGTNGRFAVELISFE